MLELLVALRYAFGAILYLLLFLVLHLYPLTWLIKLLCLLGVILQNHFYIHCSKLVIRNYQFSCLLLQRYMCCTVIVFKSLIYRREWKSLRTLFCLCNSGDKRRKHTSAENMHCHITLCTLHVHTHRMILHRA